MADTEMQTPVGAIYTTTALKAFTTLTGISPEQFVLAISNIALGDGGKITFADLIASMLSSDSGNILEVGSDELLSVKGTSVSFDDLTDTNKVIFGDSQYGGTTSTNLDLITKNGFYTCEGTATGVPSASYSWFVLHQNSNTDTATATQRAVAVDTTFIVYERIKIASEWGAWVAAGVGADQDLSNLSDVGNARISGDINFALNSGNVTAGEADLLYAPGSGTVIDTFIQPTLTSNGVLGVDELAVSSNTSGDTNLYIAFDNNDSTRTALYSGSQTQEVKMWSATPICATGLNIKQFIDGSYRYYVTAGTLYGSNDGTNWTTIGSSSWGHMVGNLTGLYSNTTYYNYHKFVGSSVTAIDGWFFYSFNLLGTKKVTISTATNIFFKTGGSYADTLMTYADKSQETLTNLASITGLSTNGTYTIVKEKGQNPTSLATPAYGKDLFVDFSQGNANDNYGLHTATVVGTPAFTGNKFVSNGATGLSYPITSLGNKAWVIGQKVKSTNIATQQGLVQGNNGSSTVSSLYLIKLSTNKLSLYLSSNSSSYDIANGVQGIKSDWSISTDYYIRTYFTGTAYKVDWSTDSTDGVDGTWTNDITVTSSSVIYGFNKLTFGANGYDNSTPLIGTMDNLQVTTGQSVCQIKNKVTQAKTFPLYPLAGDRHCDTSTGLKTYKYTTSWVENQWNYLSPNNGVTVANNVISGVSTRRYNENGYDRPYTFDSGWFAVSTNTTYTISNKLGTSNIKYVVLIADDMNGTNQRPAIDLMNNTTYYVGWYSGVVNSANISIVTNATVGLQVGSPATVSSAYFRILAEAIQ